MHRFTWCGPRAVVLAVVLATLSPAGIAQTITDHTEYTYAVRAGGIGSFADYPVTRTFDAPIASLRVFIVGGQADDIGYVGSRLVTNIPGQCAGVGAVTGEQEVTDQVTVNGDTASFLLRAQENCCCWTGWGSATQGDRANARFRWEVTLEGDCEVPPLTPITDPDAIAFEQGNRINLDGLNAQMKVALSCFQQATAAAGGSVSVTSAYRPPAYQAHLREVWDRWQLLRNNRDEGCADRRSEVRAEFQGHELLLTQRPALTSAHSRGEAFDANVTLPPGVTVDSVAVGCNLYRPLIERDPVHFIHR